MATLVLTAVGTAVGGPIGGALGAALGQRIDRSTWARPRGRQGPRLTELAVQTSSYGTQIPRLFGRMRVAGTVIWATDLRETASTEGGGKGSPSVTRYSYTASFAVALSGRPIRAVRRIWADGKLLRGAAGDWKARTGFRLYPGDEAQPVDPLIASVEGIGRAPAHRGTAYAVFEDLALEAFGNRIPSLTFEVVADDAPVQVGTIVSTVAPGAMPGDGGAALIGYSAHGDSIRGVLDNLMTLMGHWMGWAGEVPTLCAGAGAAQLVHDDGPPVRTIAAPSAAPATMTIGYYDAARDYQTGLQRTRRVTGRGTSAAIELPAVLSADAAKAVVDAAILRVNLERERRTVELGWEGLRIEPGARVRIADEAGQWRVVEIRWEGMRVRLALCRIMTALAVQGGASAGRVLPAPDRVHGPTRLAAFELPAGDAPQSGPRIGVAAAGALPGWRHAPLLLNRDGGARWEMAGGTAMPATIGVLVEVPGAGATTLEDRSTAIGVELLHAEMALAEANAPAIDAGANRAMIGDELVQFARAVQVGPTRWRIAGLWRGLNGTGFAMGTQRAGDRFVLLNAATIRVLDGDFPAGGKVLVRAAGIGDDEATVAAAVVTTGRGTVPPAPVHLRFDPATRALHWARRSRSMWRWSDGVDVPNDEGSERYRIEIATEDASFVREVDAPMATLSPDEAASARTVAVRQIGLHGPSAAAHISIN